MPILNKLEYLNATKQQIKNALNTNFNSQIEDTDTFRSYVSKIKDIYNNWPKATGTGSSLNLSPTKKGKMEIELNSTELTQDGTPTPDNPVDVNVITGSNNININNNLFSIADFENQFITGKILNDNGVEVSDAGSKYSKYKVSLKANTTYLIVGAWQRIYYYDSNGNFVSRSLAYNNGINTTYIPSTDEYIGFQVANTYYNNNKGNEKITTTEQNYPITLSSKNLFKPYTNNGSVTSNGVVYTMNSDNTITINGTATGNTLVEILENFRASVQTSTTKYLNLDSTKTYTIKANIISGTYTGTVRFYAQTNSSGGEVNSYIGNSSSITNSDGLYRAWLRVDSGASFENCKIGIQLEQGSTATEYEPYIANPLEYCKIGNYADQFFKNTIDSEFYDSTLLENEWYLKKNIGKVVWNGTENWVLAWNNLEKQLMRLYYRVALNVASTLGDSYSNYLPKATRYGNIENGEAAKICFLLEKSNYNNVVIPTTNFTDVNAWKDWLSTHNTKVYYQLATPTYIHISETDYPILRSQLDNLYNNAKSYDGQTNITQTNDDLPFNISASALMKGVE